MGCSRLVVVVNLTADSLRWKVLESSALRDQARAMADSATHLAFGLANVTDK